MTDSRHRILFALLAIMLASVPAAAQGPFASLGLSASPDEYVGEITVEYGDDFTLYVVMAGPELTALPFQLDTVEWALLGSCCGGSPAYYLDTEMSPEMAHEGDPTFRVASSANDCVTGDFIVLAAVHFNWIYSPDGPFYLGAASLAAAVACDGEPWILTGMPLQVIPTGLVPAEQTSWSDLKSLYR